MAKTIIVPLDGSEFAERALVPAAALAKRTGAHVIVMTSRIGGVVNDPERYLADAAAEAGISGADVVAISSRSFARGLNAITADVADPLVCMSTHGHSGLVEEMLGSMAEAVIRTIGVPLLLVGPNVEAALATRFDNLVVCTDGTPASRAIVPEVSIWMRQLRLRAWVVQVLDPEARRTVEEGGEDPVIEVAAVHALAESLLHRDSAGVNWEVLHRDDAADAIVDYARGVPASLIAMATHGRTGLARLALGSVTVAVVHDAPCPVLVVRPSGLGERHEPGAHSNEVLAR
jgi:nucleotide-binding universal stress UspA family protein